MLQSNKDIANLRQTETRKVLSSEMGRCRRAIEAQKITDNKDEIEIDNWNTQIEAKLAKADNEVKWLQKWQDDCKQEKETIAHEEQIKFALKLHNENETSTTLSGSDGRSQPTKMEMKKEVQAKLPKLIISKLMELT